MGTTHSAEVRALCLILNPAYFPQAMVPQDRLVVSQRPRSDESCSRFQFFLILEGESKLTPGYIWHE